MSDDSSLSGTIRARAHHTEKTLLITCLARSAAGDAVLRRISFFGSGPRAIAANFETRYGNSLGFTGCSLLQRYFEIETEVRTALYTRAGTRPAAKHLAKAEKIENILYVGKAGVETAASDAGMAKTVV